MVSEEALGGIEVKAFLIGADQHASAVMVRLDNKLLRQLAHVDSVGRTPDGQRLDYIF